jgi:hypothetical protein
MRRWVYMSVIAAVFLTAPLVYGWSGTSNAVTGPGKIRLTSREISRTRVDLGKPGRGVGDTEIVRTNLFNLRLKDQPIGHTESVCTYTTSFARSCTVTIFMPRGRLIAGGSIRYPELYELAVLGGTRLYDDARGTLTVIRTTRRPRRHIMLFRLTG